MRRGIDRTPRAGVRRSAAPLVRPAPEPARGRRPSDAVRVVLALRLRKEGVGRAMPLRRRSIGHGTGPEPEGVAGLDGRAPYTPTPAPPPPASTSARSAATGNRRRRSGGHVNIPNLQEGHLLPLPGPEPFRNREEVRNHKDGDEEPVSVRIVRARPRVCLESRVQVARPLPHDCRVDRAEHREETSPVDCKDLQRVCRVLDREEGEDERDESPGWSQRM